MPFTIHFEPFGTRLISEEPITLRDATTRAGVPLKSVCGGKTTCGKCLVQMTRGTALSPVTEAERLLLSAAEIAAGYRQACRTLVSGDLSVYVPPSSLEEEQKLQVEGAETQFEVDPVVRQYCVTVPAATLADQHGDFDRVAAVLSDHTGVALTRAGLPTLAQLSAALRASDWTITVAVRDGELIATDIKPNRTWYFNLQVQLCKERCA